MLRVSNVQPQLPPVPFTALETADLNLGRIYEGGPQPHVGADPLHRLVAVGNSGGIRYKNAKGTRRPALCALFTTGDVSEWPDGLDSAGRYVYFGDQRTPGKDIHDTSLRGNQLLAAVDSNSRRGQEGRLLVPPFLLFEKTGHGRDVRFEGVLVPASQDAWLRVERRSSPDGEYVNYRATFARLPVRAASRSWINDLLSGVSNGPAAPAPWIHWVETGATTG